MIGRSGRWFATNRRAWLGPSPPGRNRSGSVAWWRAATGTWARAAIRSANAIGGDEGEVVRVVQLGARQVRVADLPQDVELGGPVLGADLAEEVDRGVVPGGRGRTSSRGAAGRGSGSRPARGRAGASGRSGSRPSVRTLDQFEAPIRTASRRRPIQSTSARSSSAAASPRRRSAWRTGLPVDAASRAASSGSAAAMRSFDCGSTGWLPGSVSHRTRMRPLGTARTSRAAVRDDDHIGVGQERGVGREVAAPASRRSASRGRPGAPIRQRRRRPACNDDRERPERPQVTRGDHVQEDLARDPRTPSPEERRPVRVRRRHGPADGRERRRRRWTALDPVGDRCPAVAAASSLRGIAGGGPGPRRTGGPPPGRWKSRRRRSRAAGRLR